MKKFTNRKMHRRSMAAVILSAAMLMAGCSGSSTQQAQNQQTTAAAAAQDSKAETTAASNTTVIENISEAAGAGTTADKESVMIDKLNLGTAGFYTSLVPVRNGTSQWSIFVRYLYERVIYRTGDGRYIPQAAKTWECGDDGVTWTVELYDYITDSAGNHITAADVVWMIQENMDQAMKPCFNKVQSVSQTGDYTFEVVMKENMADTFEVAMASTYIVSKKAFEESEDGFANSCVTTSPYKVTEFTSGASCTLELRDDYWQKPELIEPELVNNVREITYTTISEVSQMQIALETGTVDGFSNVNASIVDAFEGNDKYQVIQAPSSSGIQLGFSGHESRPVANDVNLRKAIASCIDADGLILSVVNGRAEQMHDFVPRTSVGYVQKWNDEEYYPYDPEAAKEYLAQSDYVAGTPLKLACGSSHQKIATVIQAYCQAVGITVELDVMDAALYSSLQYDGSAYDMLLVSVGNGVINVWSNRFDSNAYPAGDATSRNDATLTEMIYNTWKNENFTEENIDKVHQYLYENAYGYGLYMPYVITIASSSLNMDTPLMTGSGEIDFAASVYSE